MVSRSNWFDVRESAMPTPIDDNEDAMQRDLDERVTVLETRFDTMLPTLATKTDLIALRAELKADNAALQAELNAGIAELKIYLANELRKAMSSMYKWMVATCITLIIGFASLSYSVLSTVQANSHAVEQMIAAQQRSR